MKSNRKLLSEVGQLKALGQLMVDKATSIEAALLAGDGKPAGTRKGRENKEALAFLANVHKTMFHKKAHRTG